MQNNNTFLSRLDWRFATKKFDATKKVSQADLDEVMRAMRFAPSSYGIQPFHIVRVDDPELRKKLQEVSYGQAQVVDASHFFVFIARNDVKERVDAYVDVVSGGDAKVKEGLKGLGDYLHGALDGRTGSDVGMAWAARQAYISLGFGLAAAAELGLDACPMEGFDASGVDKALGLPAHMHTLAYMALGYRAEGPAQPKVRFPQDDLFAIR